MTTILAQSISLQLWMLLVLLGVIIILVIALMLRSNGPAFDEVSRDAWVEQLEQRVEGLLTADRSRSLGSLERQLGIGFFDRDAKAELQALLGRMHARSKIKSDASGYRLAR